MITFQRTIGAGVALMAAIILLAGPSQSDAGLFNRSAEVAAAHAGDCCPEYCVKYRHHPTLRKICCGCCTTQQVVLVVQDPCCCKCAVEVCICIPGCCKGEPKVSSRCGILGRRIVTYEWCCGYKARVVFSGCSDVVVTTYGR